MKLTKLISKVRLETTEIAFHVAFATAPVLAVIFTLIIGKDIHLEIELGLVGAVLVVNFCLLWLRARVAKQTEEVTPFYTFLWNSLPPSRSGGEQKYCVSVTVIEDTLNQEFYRAVERQLTTELDVEHLRELLSNERNLQHPILKEQKLDELRKKLDDPDLRFERLNLGPPKEIKESESLSQQKREKFLKDFKEYLKDHLKRPTAVVLVRTNASDQRSWVYEALSDWGDDHSETPILFAQYRDQPLKDDQYANRFLWMPRDPGSLHWRLLERALKRSRAWRFQATFNRAIFWNTFYVLLLITYMAVIYNLGIRNRLKSKEAEVIAQNENWNRERSQTTSRNKEEHKIVVEAMNEALKTERLLRAHTVNPYDETFNVSYWYRIDDMPYMLVTTEPAPAYKKVPKDYKTIIGCVFSETNRLVESSLKPGLISDVRVYDRYGPAKDMQQRCTMGTPDQKPIQRIVCASVDDEPQPSSRTLGICAFSQDSANRWDSKKTQETLWAQLDNFNRLLAVRIENRKEVSQIERKPDW